MLELEKRRAGSDLARIDTPMSFADASRLLHSAVYIMRILGWAWRWAEWWVDFDSSWEPLLEPGQDEKKMSKEELKIVESTRQQRCDDARRCRLAAFGAALRNRDYDCGEDFHREALDKALRAVLHTKSLAGPMTSKEINLLVEWLGRAYRSKSRLLFMGDNKSRVSAKSPLCFHTNRSPKFELGSRPLPGTGTLIDDGIFEARVEEPDNFMRLKDGVLEQHRLSNFSPVWKRKRESASPTPRTGKVGRPRKHPPADMKEDVSTAPINRGRDLRPRITETVPSGKKRGRPPKKKAQGTSRSLSPKQAADDYLTRHFKARRERRATIEARTTVTTSDPKPKRPGRPPSKRRRANDEDNTSLQKDAAIDSAANIEATKSETAVAEKTSEDTRINSSFDVVKSRSRKKTQTLNLDDSSGKTYEKEAESSSTQTRRRRR